MRQVALSILLALPALAQNPLMLENGWVRVVMGATVPGQLSRPHVHKINRVMIHLDRGTQRIANLETKTSRDIPFTAGQVRWDPRVGLPQEPDNLRLGESLLHRPTLSLGRTLNQNATQKRGDVTSEPPDRSRVGTSSNRDSGMFWPSLVAIA